jgi:hypothetical protein
MSKQEIIRVSDDMIQGSEYVYKDDFRFQRLSKDGKWYVTYKNHIINYDTYRHDLEEWINVNYLNK